MEARENGDSLETLYPDAAGLSVGGSCCPLRMLPWKGSHPLLGQPSLVGRTDPTTQRVMVSSMSNLPQDFSGRNTLGFRLGVHVLLGE